MDELEEYTGDSKGINFIPCLKFIQRGVAKSQPDKVLIYVQIQIHTAPHFWVYTLNIDLTSEIQWCPLEYLYHSSLHLIFLNVSRSI